jgi:hypothetical protein
MMPSNHLNSGVAGMPVDEGSQQVATKTRLQAFAEDVAASHLGIDVEKVAMASAEADNAVSLGFPSADLMALIEVIAQIVVKIVETCPDGSDERLKAAIAQPTFWQRVRVKNLAKDYFVDSRHRRWRNDAGSVAQRLIECAQRADSARVQGVLDEVRSEDNWLV